MVVDSRDSQGRVRFFPLNATDTLNQRFPAWLHYGHTDSLLPFPVKEVRIFILVLLHFYSQGQDCCSDNYIGFHYISPDLMRVLEFTTYVAHSFSSRKVALRDGI